MTELVITGTEEGAIKAPRSRVTAKAQGGTEMMMDALYEKVDSELLNHFQIIPSRLNEHPIQEDKKVIFYCHDTHDDPMNGWMKDPKVLEKLDLMVFVSNWQWQKFQTEHNLSWEKSAVIKNAITPIEPHEKPIDRINLIYHTTPHRGLELLYPAFDAIYKELGDKVHLDVYSSFNAYGWAKNDLPYEPLFEAFKNHPGATYHGFQPNKVVREALKKAHIFAYPNIWPETSCIAMMEAMSAGCSVVCPNFGALPETTAGFAEMYQWSENNKNHAEMFANVLYTTIVNYDNMANKRSFQKSYADAMFNWDQRVNEWNGLLKSLL